MEIKPKDNVIVDMGTPQEEKAVVYMTSDNIAACCAIDDGDDRFTVLKSRLTKCDENWNVIPE